MRSAPCLFVFDGFADWEAAYAIAELRRSGGHAVRTLGLSGEPVVSMGGLTVLPDEDVADVDPESVRLLILPGGDHWEQAPLDPALHDFLAALFKARTPVAAICGATVALARAGFLAGRRHTSNGRDYLQEQAPGYAGAEHYVEALAVREKGLITASGLGALEFAREIFEEMGVFSAGERAEWFALFKGR